MLDQVVLINILETTNFSDSLIKISSESGCLLVFLSARPSVLLSLTIRSSISDHPSVRRSVLPFSLPLPARLSVPRSVRLSVCMSVCSSVSMCPPVFLSSAPHPHPTSNTVSKHTAARTHRQSGPIVVFDESPKNSFIS